MIGSCILFIKKIYIYIFFFFKQKTAYEILTCDWSSDVCSSDLTIILYFLLAFQRVITYVLTVLYSKKVTTQVYLFNYILLESIEKFNYRFICCFYFYNQLAFDSPCSWAVAGSVWGQLSFQSPHSTQTCDWKDQNILSYYILNIILLLILGQSQASYYLRSIIVGH